VVPVVLRLGRQYAEPLRLLLEARSHAGILLKRGTVPGMRSILTEMAALLEDFAGKRFKVREPDTISLPDLKLKPGDVIKIVSRVKSLLTVTRESDETQSTISEPFLKKLIAHMQLVLIK
jgi:hypothetical protein